MTHLDTYQLRKLIPHEELDYSLLTSVLSKYTGIHQKINNLLRSGVITRIKKGLYIFGSAYNLVPVCKETLANLIYGPSYISLEYALAYYGLIPERVETITSVTPKRNKEFKTPIGHFTYQHLKIKKYPHGIQQVWIDQNHPVLMASPEKAICDYIALNKIPDLTTPEEAKHFLESDLRIARENLKCFDPKILLKLNKYYRNKNIKSIMEAL